MPDAPHDSVGPDHLDQQLSPELLAKTQAEIDVLWQTYFTKLVSFARPRLSAAVASIVDAEDIAASVLGSLCRVATIRSLTDPDNLWPLLVSISNRKLAETKRSLFAQKRSLLKSVRLSGSPISGLSDEYSGDFISMISEEPAPDVIVICEDLLERLLMNEDATTRQIVLLTLENYTHREIALRIKRSERTVERKLQKFRGECTIILKE